MKIAWFTEGRFEGKVPRNHPNMRNDMAWMHTLDAHHYPILSLPNIQETYDIGSTPESDLEYPKELHDVHNDYPSLHI